MTLTCGGDLPSEHRVSNHCASTVALPGAAEVHIDTEGADQRAERWENRGSLPRPAADTDLDVFISSRRGHCTLETWNGLGFLLL